MKGRMTDEEYAKEVEKVERVTAQWKEATRAMRREEWLLEEQLKINANKVKIKTRNCSKSRCSSIRE